MGFKESDEKSLSDDEKKEIHAIQVACHSNSAQCKLKLKQYADAVKSCDKALAIQKDHVKSLFRRGQAHAYNNDNENALVDLKAVKKIKPDDEQIQKLLVIVRKRIRKEKKKQKKLYAGMFEKATFFTEEKPKISEIDDTKKDDTKKD